MGYAVQFVSPLTNPLSDFARHLTDLVNAFDDDAQQLAGQANGLSAYFQGQGATAFVGAVQQYATITRDTVNLFAEARDEARRYHDSVEQATHTLEGQLGRSELSGTAYVSAQGNGSQLAREALLAPIPWSKTSAILLSRCYLFSVSYAR